MITGRDTKEINGVWMCFEAWKKLGAWTWIRDTFKAELVATSNYRQTISNRPGIIRGFALPLRAAAVSLHTWHNFCSASPLIHTSSFAQPFLLFVISLSALELHSRRATKARWSLSLSCPQRYWAPRPVRRTVSFLATWCCSVRLWEK